MKKLKEDWLILVILFIPLVFVVFLWDRFPERIPTHFGWDGKPDDYGNKYTGLLLLPAINTALYFFLMYAPSINSKKFNYALLGNKYTMLRLAIHTFLSILFAGIMSYSLGHLSGIDLVLQYGVVLLFLIIGNYMNSVRQNYFVGIRTPWTLSNEKVWTKTHRVGARIWVSGSLIMLILLPFLEGNIRQFVFVFYIIVLTVIPILYSYLVFRKISAEPDSR